MPKRQHHYVSPCSSSVPPVKMDMAHLTLQSNLLSDSVVIKTQSTECFKCDLVARCQLNPQTEHVLSMDTRFGTELAVFNSSDIELCRLTNHFGEFGEYQLAINQSNKFDHFDPNYSYECALQTLKEPVNSNLPILYVASTLFCIYFLCRLAKCLWLYSDNSLLYASIGDDNQNTAESRQEDRPKRLMSVDTFRGLTIAIMIFVNYGGGNYWFFQHSAWNGLTVADLVFPWFMFIMGVSVGLTLKRTLNQQQSKLMVFLRILRRSIILIGLGLFLNSDNSTNVFYLRIPGVLQKFGISYFVVASLRLLFLKRSSTESTQSEATCVSCLRDIVDLWQQWCIVLTLTIVHTVVTFMLPVPDCPTGYLGPGGLGDNGRFPNCTGGAAGYLDRVIFGNAHIYQRPTCKSLYQTTLPYDPEGFLGNVGSILITFLGVQSGEIIVQYSSVKSRIIRWVIWSIITGLLAGILCGFSQNDGWIPVNKNLWSVSYVLALASMAFVLLSLLYLVTDHRPLVSGAPLYQAGRNAILLYLGHELFHNFIPISYEPLPESHFAHLAMDLWGTTFWMFVACYLNYRKIYFAV